MEGHKGSPHFILLLFALAVRLALVEGAVRVPSQVTGLSLFKEVVSGAPALRVNWYTPQSNMTFRKYHLQYRMNGTTTWGSSVAITGSPPMTTAILTALNAGTKYSVRVRAESAVGAGMWSEEQSERTYMFAPNPSSHHTVSAVPVARRGVIRVSWSAPTVQSGELPITGYIIRYNVQNGNVFRLKHVTAISVEAMITGLLPGSVYQVYVAGVNAISIGRYCCEGTPVVVRTHNLPSQVTGMTVSKAVSLGKPALRVTWTTPQSDVAITQYQVQHRKRDASWGAVNHVTSGATTSTVLKALDDGIAYQVRIGAVSAIGIGEWSRVESETTYMRAPHPDPMSLRVVAVNRSGVIQVSWSAPTVSSGELPVTGYSIRYKMQNGNFQYKTVTLNSFETTITGLAPGTAYQAYVAGINNIGRGPYCCEGTPFVVRTYNATPQPVVYLANSTLHSLSIGWSVMSPQDVTSYIVFWWTESTDTSRSVALNGAKFVIDDLRSNTAYLVMVMASGPLGNVNSTKKVFYTPPYLVQGSLNVLVLTNYILQVSWEPADDAGQSLINYIVNTTTTDMEYNNSTSVKYPITSISITEIPQCSAGTVSVWAKNPGALSEPVISRFKMVNIVSNVTGVSAECVGESLTSLRMTLPEGGTYRISYLAVNKRNALEPRVITTTSSLQVIKDFSPDYFCTILVEAGNDSVGKGEESIASVECNDAVTVGSFLGGLVAGMICLLLVMGIVLGIAKLRKERKGTKSRGEEEKQNENTYDTVQPKEAAALSDHVAMETNPAYASVQ